MSPQGENAVAGPTPGQPSMASHPPMRESTRLREAEPALTSTLGLAIRRYAHLSAALLFRPRAALRAGVVDPPVGALSPTELIVWALPPSLALALAAALNVALASLVSFVPVRAAGGLGVNLAGALILGVLGGGTTALLAAVLWHPLLGLLVRIFGGASDARLRSNVFVAQGASAILLAIATLLGTVLRLAPLRMAASLPMVVLFPAAILTLLVWHAWRARLGMARPFDVLLVLGGLAMAAVVARALLTLNVAPPQELAAVRVNAELSAASRRLDQAQEKLAAGNAPTAEPKPPVRTIEPKATAVSSWTEYQRRRSSIDEAVRRDRGLFERISGLAKLYARLQKDTERVDQELAKKNRRGKAPPSDHQRDALVQARTATQVDTIYELLTKR